MVCVQKEEWLLEEVEATDEELFVKCDYPVARAKKRAPFNTGPESSVGTPA